MISKSSGKITKVSNADDVEIKYGHIIQVLTDWIDTTILVSIDGRGMAKSTVIQARRSARCVEEMPGGAFAFVANTYSNLEDNIMPAVQKGWQLMGLIEGVHLSLIHILRSVGIWVLPTIRNFPFSGARYSPAT